LSIFNPHSLTTIVLLFHFLKRVLIGTLPELVKKEAWWDLRAAVASVSGDEALALQLQRRELLDVSSDEAYARELQQKLYEKSPERDGAKLSVHDWCLKQGYEDAKIETYTGCDTGENRGRPLKSKGTSIERPSEDVKKGRLGSSGVRRDNLIGDKNFLGPIGTHPNVAVTALDGSCDSDDANSGRSGRNDVRGDDLIDEKDSSELIGAQSKGTVTELDEFFEKEFRELAGSQPKVTGPTVTVSELDGLYDSDDEISNPFDQSDVEGDCENEYDGYEADSDAEPMDVTTAQDEEMEAVADCDVPRQSIEGKEGKEANADKPIESA
jgi:hypothetical protein